MIERYNGANRVRRLHGMRGYGIYLRVVELCASAPDKKLRYDLDDLVYDMREKRELIKEIVEDFGLFVLEGEFLEDVYARSPEAIERERQERIRANRSAGAKRAAQTRRERRQAARQEEENDKRSLFDSTNDDDDDDDDDEDEDDEEETSPKSDARATNGPNFDFSRDFDMSFLKEIDSIHPANFGKSAAASAPARESKKTVQPLESRCSAPRTRKTEQSQSAAPTAISAPTSSPQEQARNTADEPSKSQRSLEPRANANGASSRDELSERFDRVKDAWNALFKGTRRMAHYLNPDQTTWRNFTESASFYTDEDFIDAINQAKQDKKFIWQLRDVLKPSNMQRLLSDVEAERQRKKEEEEKLDPATREMMEYGRKMGWNWTQT